jgi:hypothetical protein
MNNYWTDKGRHSSFPCSGRNVGLINPGEVSRNNFRAIVRELVLMTSNGASFTMGCILLIYPFVMVQSIILLWKNKQLNGVFEWLESFPAGTNVNVAHRQSCSIGIGTTSKYRFVCSAG